MKATALSRYDEDEAVIDAAIEVAINRVIGDSFLPSPSRCAPCSEFRCRPTTGLSVPV